MPDQEQRLLMLIDDEPAQSRLITALASREGWRTLVVGDSETAIATLAPERACSFQRSSSINGFRATTHAR